MNNIDIREVNFAECIPKIGHLLEMHFDELDLGFPLDISTDMYAVTTDIKMLFALAAFDGDKIVGYCTMTMAPHMANPAVIFAAHDLLFVMPEYRSKGIGRQLMSAAEVEAKARGANRVLWHTRSGTSLSESMEKGGYTKGDIVMEKEI